MFPRASINVLRSAARVAPKQTRAIHIENVVGNNTPFDYSNGRSLAIKMILLYGGGFCIPFMAAAYQIKKASA